MELFSFLEKNRIFPQILVKDSCLNTLGRMITLAELPLTVPPLFAEEPKQYAASSASQSHFNTLYHLSELEQSL